MKTDDAFHGISTMLTADTPYGQSQGTGFFYDVLGPRDPNQEGGQWREVKGLWIVTNRHVLLPGFDGQETLPHSFTFRLRKLVGDQILWEPVVLNQEDILRRAKFHSDATVDVAVLEVFDLVRHKVAGDDKYMNWYAVGEEQLPGNNDIFVEVADDAMVVGYPRRFYDEFNVFPVVKSGIIASRWGAYFNGQPNFLIDAKLFPGSSGSIVVSRPKDIVVANGQLLYNKEEKPFAFLGIFSGFTCK